MYQPSGDKKILGLIAVADTIKDTSRHAVKMLQEMKIRVYMITGDNSRTANAVAKQAGINNVFSEVLPEDKADYVKKLQKSGKVAMVGDGINDAPALAKASVGISLSNATQVAVQTAQIVLLNDKDLSQVYEAYLISKHTLKTIKQNLFWALMVLTF